jgi:hypothetical protein
MQGIYRLMALIRYQLHQQVTHAAEPAVEAQEKSLEEGKIGGNRGNALRPVFVTLLCVRYSI